MGSDPVGKVGESMDKIDQFFAIQEQEKKHRLLLLGDDVPATKRLNESLQHMHNETRVAEATRQRELMECDKVVATTPGEQAASNSNATSPQDEDEARRCRAMAGRKVAKPGESHLHTDAKAFAAKLAAMVPGDDNKA